MRPPGSSPRRRSSGMAAVELALCMPVLTLFLAAMLDLGRAMEVTQILTNSAREAGRQASIGALSNSQITQVVTNYLAAQGISTTNVTITITDTTTSGATPATAGGGDSLRVTVTTPTANVLWIKGISGSLLPAQLSSQATWCAVRGPN